MSKKIVFTGGGTVGHVTLNLILIPKFVKDGWEVHYIGDKKGVEYQEIRNSGLAVTFHGIATGKLRRYFSWQNLLDIFKVGFGVVQSLLILLRLRPQLLFSKGGFVSVPPVIAARLTGVPVYIHESDLSMGLANKIAYKFATGLFTTFEPEKGLTKARHVGAITKVGETQPQMDLVSEVQAQFAPDRKTLLFVGGSGGAKVFNDFISANPSLTEDFNIINISGDPSLDLLTRGLYRVAYVTQTYLPLLTMADLVITRGGSNTLFELLAMQKPHLIVPLGKAASRGDQLENAAYFEDKGYALQLGEDQLTLDNVKTKVVEIFAREAELKAAMAASQDLTSAEDFYQLLVTSLEKG